MNNGYTKMNLIFIFYGIGIGYRQRMGEELDGLNIDELRGLEQNVDEALKLVRQRKVRRQSLSLSSHFIKSFFFQF